jgi:hypothetical protein
MQPSHDFKKRVWWSPRRFFEQPSCSVKPLSVMLYALFSHKYSFMLVPEYCKCKQCLIMSDVSSLEELFSCVIQNSSSWPIVFLKWRLWEKCSITVKVLWTYRNGNWCIQVIVMDLMKCQFMVQGMERLSCTVANLWTVFCSCWYSVVLHHPICFPLSLAISCVIYCYYSCYLLFELDHGWKNIETTLLKKMNYYTNENHIVKKDEILHT